MKRLILSATLALVALLSVAATLPTQYPEATSVGPDDKMRMLLRSGDNYVTRDVTMDTIAQATVDIVPGLAAATNAGTATLNVTNLTFQVRSVIRPMMPGRTEPRFLIAEENYDSGTPFTFEAPSAANPDPRITNGMFQVLGEQFHIARATPRIPFVSVELDVAAMATGTTTNRVEVGLCDPTTAGTNRVVAHYNHQLGTLYLLSFTNGSQTLVASTAWTNNGGAFGIALVLADQSWSVWTRIGTSWTPRLLKSALANLGDVREPAQLAKLRPMWKGDGRHAAGPNGIYVDAVRMRYSGGLSIANPAWITYDDGSPLIRDNKAYFLANASAPADAGYGISSSHACIWTLDLNSFAVEQTAKLCFLRSGRIYGENSGAIVYDPDLRRFRLMVPNWGDNAGGAVYTYLYETADNILNGVHILRNGVDMNLPTATSEYDPSLVKIGGTNWITYSATTSLTTWTSAYPAIAWSTDTSLTNWNFGATNGTHTAEVLEGSKLTRVGGQWVALFGHRTTENALTFRAYDLGLNELANVYATETNTFNSSSSPHPNLLVAPRDGGSSVVLITHDAVPWSNIPFTYGNFWILESTNTQSGYEFPRKNGFLVH